MTLTSHAHHLINLVSRGFGNALRNLLAMTLKHDKLFVNDGECRRLNRVADM
jgi:hypothetical protein